MSIKTIAMSHKGKKDMSQKLRKITKSERGSAAVEFALLLPKAQIQGFVAQSLANGGVPAAGINVTVNGLGTGQGNPLTVTSSIPWQYMVIDGLIPSLSTSQLQATVVMMNE
jgi:Flp pilus assembly protein TadG